MKTVNVIIIIAAIVVLLLVVWHYRVKEKLAQKAREKKLMDGVIALTTRTVIVDPTTNQEFIISDIGENNIDNSVGSASMNISMIKVIEDINYRAGSVPTMLTLKLYDAKNNLLNTTTIANPLISKVPSGKPAQMTQVETGINYSCSVGQLSGPAFYNQGSSNSASLMYGMFCK